MTENIPKIKEITIKKFETLDGKQFNTELEALHHIKTLETKVYVLKKIVSGIKDQFYVEGVYEDYDTAENQKQVLNELFKEDVVYRIEECKFFKKERTYMDFYIDNMTKINSKMMSTLSETSKEYVSIVGTKLQDFSTDETAMLTKK